MAVTIIWEGGVLGLSGAAQCQDESRVSSRVFPAEMEGSPHPKPHPSHWNPPFSLSPSFPFQGDEELPVPMDILGAEFPQAGCASPSPPSSFWIPGVTAQGRGGCRCPHCCNIQALLGHLKIATPITI